MAENAAHAPGSMIGNRDGGIRQRKQMAMGGGPLPGGNFGVGSIPGTHHLQGHGDHVPHDGVHLHDHHRSGPPALHQGDGNMHATAHSHHGPHHHSHQHHHVAPKGTQHHHVGGKVEMAAMRGGVPHRGRGKH